MARLRPARTTGRSFLFYSLQPASLDSIVLTVIRRIVNQIERCWGVLEQHWNGTQLTTLEMAFAWAKSMTCCPGWTQSRDDNLSRSVNSRGVANTQTTLGRAFVKKLPRESTVLPRSGFVGTFLLSGCLSPSYGAEAV